MSLDEIKQIIENEEGKVFLIENGKPIAVIINFEEYKKNFKKNNFVNLSSFPKLNLNPASFRSTEKCGVKKELPKELKEEELRIEDLPF